MKKKAKKYVSVLVLILLLLGVTVGFSALSTSLNITGTSKIKVATWDVHFENVEETTGSVDATTAPTISTNNGVAGTKITYAVELTTPGDFYEFTVDVVNDGSVDAKLSALPTLSGVSTAQEVYTNYTFTHANASDGAIAVGEVIKAGESKKFKVRVEFDSDISASDLPTENQEMELTVDMNYEQA